MNRLLKDWEDLLLKLDAFFKAELPAYEKAKAETALQSARVQAERAAMTGRLEILLDEAKKNLSGQP